MKISVKLEVSENSKHHTFDLDDLDLIKEQWETMSDSQKQDAIEKAVFDLPDQPYWMVDSFKEK